MNKKIAAITMARNDNWILSRWISYYGRIIGDENLYIYLDGTDQCPPENAGRANVAAIPRRNMPRLAGDEHRIDLLSDLAADLFSKGYDIVIGCDADEFLVLDPNIGDDLVAYLSSRKIRGTISVLGVDIGQNMKTEGKLDPDKPILEQREFAVLSPIYTKAVILSRPLRWGRGFHRVRGRIYYHIDPNLYLFHAGNLDYDMIDAKMRARNGDWVAHLMRQATRTIDRVTKRQPRGGEFKIKLGRVLQRIFHRSWNKPGGPRIAIKIPSRFKKVAI